MHGVQRGLDFNLITMDSHWPSYSRTNTSKHTNTTPHDLLFKVHRYVPASGAATVRNLLFQGSPRERLLTPGTFPGGAT